ncbi:hypothetical protein AGMMS49938_11880 [Fibrobacterales bacterium]|nr:hypothetical protein AGMMS49938_11880 [Fibrobacterales bacterium]
MLENGKSVIAVETKTDLGVKHVNAHIKRIEKLRKIARFNGKEIYGAMTFAFADKRQINHALKCGLFVLKQPDVLNVSILDFPVGHNAKAW